MRPLCFKGYECKGFYELISLWKKKNDRLVIENASLTKALSFYAFHVVHDSRCIQIFSWRGVQVSDLYVAKQTLKGIHELPAHSLALLFDDPNFMNYVSNSRSPEIRNLNSQ